MYACWVQVSAPIAHEDVHRATAWSRAVGLVSVDPGGRNEFAGAAHCDGVAIGADGKGVCQDPRRYLLNKTRSSPPVIPHLNETYQSLARPHFTTRIEIAD